MLGAGEMHFCISVKDKSLGELCLSLLEGKEKRGRDEGMEVCGNGRKLVRQEDDGVRREGRTWCLRPWGPFGGSLQS